MPSIHSSEFGELTFEVSDVYRFPEGLHGFEDSKDYIVVMREGLAPFCFLQSISHPALRFICLPAIAVDSAYQVQVGAEDAGDLLIAAGSYPPAAELQVLTILTIPERGAATANLFAPIVLTTVARRGRQCIQFETSASATHPVPWMAPRDSQVVA